MAGELMAPDGAMAEEDMADELMPSEGFIMADDMALEGDIAPEAMADELIASDGVIMAELDIMAEGLPDIPGSEVLSPHPARPRVVVRAAAAASAANLLFMTPPCRCAHDGDEGEVLTKR
ncbi:hypothetical protein [Acidipropionibacterium timonense]|uniref:hypothetical protein n=1 Tax=Acidipropionibacterium timonense TaxID=2161818 RepID=UPI00103245C2|nr:hypothetical protein [Acidipropionibacterium timonense]